MTRVFLSRSPYFLTRYHPSGLSLHSYYNSDKGKATINCQSYSSDSFWIPTVRFPTSPDVLFPSQYSSPFPFYPNSVNTHVKTHVRLRLLLSTLTSRSTIILRPQPSCFSHCDFAHIEPAPEITPFELSDLGISVDPQVIEYLSAPDMRLPRSVHDAQPAKRRPPEPVKVPAIAPKQAPSIDPQSSHPDVTELKVSFLCDLIFGSLLIAC